MPSALGYVRGPLVIPQTAQMRLIWQLANTVASNVLHAIVPDDFHWTQTDVDDVFNGITASPGWALIAPLLATTTTLLGIEIKDLRAANLAGIPSSAPEDAGTGGDNALPDQLAILASLKTAQAGRSFRGRVYIPGWTVLASNPVGVPTGDAVTAALGFVTSVAAAMAVKNFELAIGHRGHALYVSPATGLNVPAELAGSVVVTSITVPGRKFETQRRRT